MNSNSLVSDAQTFTSLDSVHTILDLGAHPLSPFFSPKVVAVIGASQTPGSVGRTLLWNLISNPFGGMVFPVNPKRSSILGIKAYSTIKEVPALVDLAIIVTPASTVSSILNECAQAGVRHVIVISAGFKEMGESGVLLENEIAHILKTHQMRLIGPNCLGVMCPKSGLNATFAKGMANAGNVAFLSQSGALLTAVLDWSHKEQVGFSACLSLGSMLDVNWGDLITYFGNDPTTHSILIYMESIGDASAFLSAAREVSLNKPIIVIKAGRTAQAAKAAASHTGSLTGSDEVLDAAFERAGVLRVDTIAELFNMAEVLAKQPRPKGPRLTIVTNAGGPAVLATDALILSEAELAPLSQNLYQKLDKILPPSWSRSNPIDILGDAAADRYALTLEALAEDANSDGLLVILTPQDMTEPLETAKLLAAASQKSHKPILASWMGAGLVEPAVQLLNKTNIPTFESPDTAASTFSHMWRYSKNLKNLYETPKSYDQEDVTEQDRQRVHAIIQKAQAAKRSLLTEIESKQILASYKLPVGAIEYASSEEEAVQKAQAIGFPVVLKVCSETISHKTDVGGIALNLSDEPAVRQAYQSIYASINQKVGAQHFQGVSVQPMIHLKDSYELIIGSSLDAQFGPVLMFGSGGQLVEIYKDYSLALPPLTSTLAKRMMIKTKIFKALQGIRGRSAVNMQALEKVLVRFSQLIADHSSIAEIEINPLLINDASMMILDARASLILTDDPCHKPAQLAIRPYPAHLETHHQLTPSLPLTIRLLRPEDEPLMTCFYEDLCLHPQTRAFLNPLNLDIQAQEKLISLCFSDYSRELCFIAIEPQHQKVIAIAKLKRSNTLNQAHFSLFISPSWQHQGIGTFLVKHLLNVAAQEKIQMVSAYLQSDNKAMLSLCKKLGFTQQDNKLLKDNELSEISPQYCLVSKMITTT